MSALFTNKLIIQYDDQTPVQLIGPLHIQTPEFELWTQLFLLLLLQSAFSAVIGYVVYQVVVQRRVRNERCWFSSQVSFGIIFGAVLPITLVFPFFVIWWLQIENRFLRMSLSTAPTLCSLRLLEAVAGFSPVGVETSLRTFVIYFASNCQIVMDNSKSLSHPVPLKSNTGYLRKKGKSSFNSFVFLLVLFSICAPVQFILFEERMLPNSMSHNIYELFQINHLLNNFVAALILQSLLTFGCEVIGFLIALLFRLQTHLVFDNPVLASNSAANFWGERWNLLVHGLLKRSIYKPSLRYGYSRTNAAMMTFLASGILHEYVWLIMFYDGQLLVSQELKVYEYFYGKSILFFGWNGAIIMCEQLLFSTQSAKKFDLLIPRYLKTALVLLTVLPISHLFTGDWIEGKVFAGYMVGFPLLSIQTRNN